MSKRSGTEIVDSGLKKPKDASVSIESGYHGYKILEDGIRLDSIPIPTTNEGIEDFFENYVKKRKPCKFNQASKDFNWNLLKPENIKETLDNEVLQIEQKSNGGFGSGSKRVFMKFHDFIDKLQNGNHDLYLTTQYAEHEIEGEDSQDEEETPLDDDEESEEEDSAECGRNMFPDDVSEVGFVDSINFNDLRDDFEEMQENDDSDDGNEEGSADDLAAVRELYQPPLDKLVNEIPEQLHFLKLVPQQINIWVGSASEKDSDQSFLGNFDPNDEKLGLGRNIPGGGSSSGLHHDHADNIYIPVSGRKRFTLFAPSDVTKMYTVGDVANLYDTGIINYKRNENAPTWDKLRADGAIETQYAQYKLDDPNIPEPDRKEYNMILTNESENDIKKPTDNQSTLDPPSFSTIPPTVVHLDKIEDQELRNNIEELARKKWPKFFTAHRTTIDLKPGEMLFLPTGWFHEVTSFGSTDGNEDSHDINVAVNYWLMPPTGNSINNMYKDGYWNSYMDSISNALQRVRQKSDRL